MRVTLIAMACAVLVGCGPSIPESGYQGVGFEDYDAYEAARRAREAELTGSALPSPTAMSSEPLSATAPLDATSGADGVAANTQAVLAQTGAAGVPVPQTVATAGGISAENDFEAVDAQRSIESDAALMAQNRAQYKVIEPTALPTRSGSGEPNIVSFALNTTHAPGTPVYRRSSASSESRFQRSCAKYASGDQAQLDFLKQGGPERDRLGVDPDGDGFACDWDPRPFRAVTASGGGT